MATAWIDPDDPRPALRHTPKKRAIKEWILLGIVPFFGVLIGSKDDTLRREHYLPSMHGHIKRIPIRKLEQEGVGEPGTIHLINKDSFLTGISIPIAATALRGRDTVASRIPVPHKARFANASRTNKNNDFHLPSARGPEHQRVQIKGAMIAHPLREVTPSDLLG